MTTTLPACWKPRLACPFCGSNFLFTEPDEYGSGGQWVSPIHVGCNDCKAEQVGDTEEEAVSRWNARATPPASAQDEPITVSLDPDPRGVSVGVWQGSSCIYTGAHAIPGSAPDAPLASMARAIFGDKIGGQMDAMAGAPSLSSLRGLAPGACDGMKSEDYVNKVRNGDWSSPHCTPASVAPGDAQDERSPTHGMTLGERIAHVGGRTNAQSYIEFGSPMAVNALIQHVLRDLDWTRQDDDGAYQARYRLPGGQWSTWGHVVCGVKGHEQELRYLPGERRPAPAAGDALTDAARDVLAERRHQVEIGYDAEHDDAHVNDEIAALACYYLMPPGAREWPATETGYGDTLGEAMVPNDWHADDRQSRRRQLIMGTAMGLAEIERLDRAAIAAQQGKGEAA